MALNLQQIRDYVRNHIELEIDDLPDSVLDVFIREGSKRVEKAETRWPFYEESWTLTTAIGTRNYALTGAVPTATAVDQLTNVQGPKWNLVWIGREQYDVLNPPDFTSQSEPTHVALWDSELWLSPTPDAAYTLTLRGYRKPTDWVANGAAAQPDLPDELHNTVATWALSRAYAQQDDPELAAVYERQFGEELNEFRRRIVETPHLQPVILNRGHRPRSLFGRLRYDWEL